MRSCLAKLATAAAFVLAAPSALAAVPEPWGIDLQPAATESADRINDFHNLLLYIIIGVTLFVLALLIVVMVRFNRRANPVPSKTTHNTLIEVVWTVVPVMILVVIAVPSFKLLYANEKIPSDIALTIKAIGKQWFWTYEYPDNGNFTFDATMLADDARGDQPRLLAVDNFMVVPEDTKVRVIVTASDVIHAWAVPAFGKKIDAVPGRLNELWFEARDPGIYYGQCSELCGANHAFMPIGVKVVTKEEYAAWVAQAQQEFGKADTAPTSVATAPAGSTVR
ncbi:MAG: cytochrome c oxidase subunit II [Alphaproteobacteria bacterium]|nr:cytochrome c oxidase subunit II [Alphaproteobacteria bacterium]